MRVGCIGLGDIAQKAYLPVLMARPGLEPHLHTRTAATLQRVGDTYRVPDAQRHTDLIQPADLPLKIAFPVLSALGRLLRLSLPSG